MGGGGEVSVLAGARRALLRTGLDVCELLRGFCERLRAVEGALAGELAQEAEAEGGEAQNGQGTGAGERFGGKPDGIGFAQLRSGVAREKTGPFIKADEHDRGDEQEKGGGDPGVHESIDVGGAEFAIDFFQSGAGVGAARSFGKIEGVQFGLGVARGSEEADLGTRIRKSSSPPPSP